MARKNEKARQAPRTPDDSVAAAEASAPSNGGWWSGLLARAMGGLASGSSEPYILPAADEVASPAVAALALGPEPAPAPGTDLVECYPVPYERYTLGQYDWGWGGGQTKWDKTDLPRAKPLPADAVHREPLAESGSLTGWAALKIIEADLERRPTE